MAEQKISLSDIKEMQSRVNVNNKRIEIEKRNLAASFKIKAHENMQDNTEKESIVNLRNSVSAQIKANDLPLDAYKEVYSGLITQLKVKIDYYEGKKADKGGTLTAGEENALKDFKKNLITKEEELAKTIASYGTKEQEVKDQEAERLSLIKEKEEIAKAEKEAALRLSAEAQVGRKSLEETVRNELREEEVQRKIELKKRGLEVSDDKAKNGKT